MAAKRASASKSRKPKQTRFRIGFYFGEEKLGPGKIALLQAIDETGSISAAARQQGLGYRQAWERVESLNRCFREPVVVAASGGRSGGGATLTPFGEELVTRFEQMEKRALAAVRADLASLSRQIR